jgi:death on curing protein
MNFIWLTQELVSAFHLRQLAEHGGGTGVRDLGLLDSALQRPKNKINYGGADIAELAAAYAFGIARNHPFIDGNKRTALVASFTFLHLNGYKTKTSQAENVTVFLALAAGTLSEDNLAIWFRSNLQKLD